MRPPIILASASPRRAELLARLGVSFTVRPCAAPEEAQGGPPQAQVMGLALRKAKHVAQSLDRGLVLAADTLVFLEGKPLGKPGSGQEAADMLASLSGRWHQVLTGVCLMDADGGYTQDCAGAWVHMTKLSKEAIEAYVRSGEPMDKAGAYGIQGLGGTLIDAIDGDYYAVVGLPLALTRRMLEDRGVKVL